MTVKSYMSVADFFNGDIAKTRMWFDTTNYQMGGVSPNTLIKFGRGEKLAEMIQYLVEEAK